LDEQESMAAMASANIFFQDETALHFPKFK
jgi:hypothetical protein